MRDQTDPSTGEIRDPGREYPDTTPVAKPVGWKPPNTLRETIQRFVREEYSRLAESQGAESFEDADDFDVGDDAPDRTSPYELDEETDQLPRWDEKGQREAAILDAEEKIAARYRAEKASGMAPDEPTSRRTGKGGSNPPPARKRARSPAEDETEAD